MVGVLALEHLVREGEVVVGLGGRLALANQGKVKRCPSSSISSLCADPMTSP